jgi:hypothetical protein
MTLIDLEANHSPLRIELPDGLDGTISQCQAIPSQMLKNDHTKADPH